MVRRPGKRLRRYADLSRAYGFAVRPSWVTEAQWQIGLLMNEGRVRSSQIVDTAIALQMGTGSAKAKDRATVRALAEGGDLESIEMEEVMREGMARDQERAAQYMRRA